MTKKMKTIVRTLAIILAVLTPFASATIAIADSSGDLTPPVASKYSKPDINALTGHGAEPEEISVSAAATYQKKEWYEYITYSDKAVASYRLNDDGRLLFYDPFTYTNAMIMDVQFDATTTEFDTVSSYEISHTTSKTMTSGSEQTHTSTEATEHAEGRDETSTNIKNSGTLRTVYRHNEATHGDEHSQSELFHDRLETEIGMDNDLGTALVHIEGGADFGSITTYNNTYTQHTGYDDVWDNTASTTEGWTQLADRITKSTGSSRSTNASWSELEGATVTKTYAATHFAADGVTPLPWAIVHYTVQMPMKCCLQYKYEGEWITVATVYCMLTTINGACRAWIQDGQTYYEDWGNGEPVVATDFWAQFMTKDQLMNAYQNKLYPKGGEE